MFLEVACGVSCGMFTFPTHRTSDRYFARVDTPWPQSLRLEHVHDACSGLKGSILVVLLSVNRKGVLQGYDMGAGAGACVSGCEADHCEVVEGGQHNASQIPFLVQLYATIITTKSCMIV